MLKRIKKSGGFSLIELLACPCESFYSYGSSGPGHCRYIKSARRAAAYTDPRSRQTQYSCICMMKKKQGA